VIGRSDAIIKVNAEERAAAAAAGERLPRGEYPWQPVYDIYTRITDTNRLTRPSAGYLRKIADTAHGRPPGAVSDVQRTGESIEELARTGRLTGGRYERDFFRYIRANADYKLVHERIYLNVTADHAPEVMRAVVRDLIDSPDYGGLYMAKLIGPGDIVRRADTIIIYANDTAAVQKAMRRIRAYHAANPEHFQKATPYMTDRILEGVGVGSEPPATAAGLSFGGLRSSVIHDALRRSMTRGDKLEEFMHEVFHGLRRAGIDPAAPHLNLPPAVTP
jgi:hypothetical protein